VKLVLGWDGINPEKPGVAESKLVCICPELEGPGCGCSNLEGIYLFFLLFFFVFSTPMCTQLRVGV
jgi:hypothetical protein